MHLTHATLIDVIGTLRPIQICSLYVLDLLLLCLDMSPRTFQASFNTTLNSICEMLGFKGIPWDETFSIFSILKMFYEAI